MPATGEKSRLTGKGGEEFPACHFRLCAIDNVPAGIAPQISLLRCSLWCRFMGEKTILLILVPWQIAMVR
jgi:hypothetical protein